MKTSTKNTTLSRRQFGLAALGLGSLALTLSACGGSGSGSTSKKLQLILSGDTSQGGAFAAAAAAYKQQTGVDIEVVDVPTSDIMTKLKNAASANDLPALARVTGLDPLWVDQLQDLTATAKAQKINISLLQNSPDGQITAIPSDLTAVGLFINKSLFDKAGVEVPTTVADAWTWDAFIASLQSVLDKTEAKYGLVVDRSGHRIRALMYQFGSTAFVPKDDEPYAGDAAADKALEFFKAINDDKMVPKSVYLSSEDPSAMFKSGRVAAYFSGSWQIADFDKNIKDFDWLAVPSPKQPLYATNLGGGFMVAFKDTGHDQEAAKFIDWFYQDANYTAFAEKGGYLPVKDIKIKYPFRQEAFDLYNESIAANEAPGSNSIQRTIRDGYTGVASIGDPIKDETVNLIAGTQDVKTTVTKIAKALNDA